MSKSSFGIWRSGLFAALMLTSVSAVAETKQLLGAWEVHYSAFRSTFIAPEIARQYDIERSRYLALVNISVLDRDTKVAQRASLSGYATNGIGNRLPLEFTEVVEGDAVYYLAQAAYTNLETLRFTIEVRADGETQELRFSQQFYADE